MTSTIMESVRSQGSDQYSLSSMRSEFDVFLSFRGPDARYGIVDHLYECMTGAGLRVFKDDEEIHRGEVIGGELKRAINGSRIYAVVFSRNYASSAWCLRELDMMVDLRGGSNVGRKIILPIFYGADPADVKLCTELYWEALDTHKDRHGQDVVKKWEEALKTVGRISGWDSKAIQGEGRFVRLIVQDIVVKLRIKDKSLPDHLTGFDDRVFDMLNLLDCDSLGVRLVVLHGMGGIGKTTIARVIFNELHSRFEGSSFVSDVRETSKGHGGIEKLQNKLSGDILGGQNARSCNYDGEIIRRIRCKRVLLVLDDVDAHSQLEKLLMKNPEDTLGTGSRVIITTRDKSVCNRFVRLSSKLLHFYETDKMRDNHALQLFSRHAFGTDEPPEDYLCLSKQVVKTTGNLPLALEVIGGHLCCQSKESWKYELEKLKNVPLEEVFDILKVSYEGLGFREKEIFLDIVCFRQTMRRRYADFLWEARDLHPKSGVKVLINKSLIKIDSNGEFWIHDQLRDMGREIIRSEGLGRPEMCTRLWDPNDALKIVLQKKVSEKIIAMDLDLGSIIEEHKLSYENFRGLFNLMYLHLKGTHQSISDFGSIRETLTWLYWWNCNIWTNPGIFKMSNLVVLKIEGRWGSIERLIMPNLRMLEVWRSDMTMTPDFSCCLKLEIMVFEKCTYLNEIHHSVGKLESLTYMNISTCRFLRSLPKELCCARALQELVVTDCKIKEVPESIGRLESLRTLDLRCNTIKRLPASISDLNNLLVLHVSQNPLDKGIPEEIGRLSALEDLDLSCSKIRFLPMTVSRLMNLKSLKLISCMMLQELRGLPTSLMVLDASSCPLDKGIPEEIGSLSSLEELNLSYTNIRFLPATVSRLTSLKSLRLDGCGMLQELQGLPTSLTVLHASYCPLDEGILEGVRSLSDLEDLDLSGCKIRFLLATVSQLSSLKSLRLNCCRMLQELRGLPTSLTLLDASSCPLDKGIPEEIWNMSSLEELYLSYTNIHFLPATVSRLTSLKFLRLDGCEMLQELRGLPTSLTVLHALNCPLDKGIPEEIGNLSALEELDLSGSKIRFLPATFGQLTSLKSLILDCCEMLQEVQGLPTSLTYFAFSSETMGLSAEIRCIKKYGTRIITFRGAFELGFLYWLKTLGWSSPEMASLQTILEMEIREFTLTEMELGGLVSLPSLTKLSINNSDSLVRVSNIGRLRGLRSLWFTGCPALVEIPGLEQLEMLEALIFDSCDSICGIQDLLGLKRLKGMAIWRCSSWLHVPRVIDECGLSIFGCDKSESFDGPYREYRGKRKFDRACLIRCF